MVPDRCDLRVPFRLRWKRPPHRAAHQNREQGARRADERAADDQGRVVEHEPRRRGRQPGARVQERDDHRHVGPADRDDEQDADGEADDRDGPERRRALGDGEADDQEDEQDALEQVDVVAPGQQDRLAAHPPVELQEGDDRAGEGDGADGGAERHLDQAGAMDMAGVADAECLRRIERAVHRVLGEIGYGYIDWNALLGCGSYGFSWNIVSNRFTLHR
jgi:hypothetical protein